MKSISELLHKTPWWLLLGGGLLVLAGMAVFSTPFHLMRLEKSGTTKEENRAIKREIDTAFSEGAIDVARGIVRELRNHTKDPARRAELDHALQEIEEARSQLREAGEEVIRAKREAAQNVTQAVEEATRSITQAQRDAARALREAGVDNEKVSKSLEESVRLAREAEAEARAAAEERAKTKVEEAKARVEEARRRAREQRRIILGEAPRGSITIDLDKPPPTSAAPPLPDLPPELRERIRRDISGDLRRIGVGAGMILIFIPLFILLVVSKFFIDRSRASLKVADVKRKEADYHRMAQQVTEAKLQALQAQVEPHFLYNTLASVQALTEVDPARANTLTGHLIMYLRNALPKMRESISTVEQEIELVRAYLNILQMRMGDRLTFEIDVPPELMNAPVPPLMLPTLVENAIKHGLEPQREGGKVTIKAEGVAPSGTGSDIRDQMIRLSVADTGKGFAETLGNGVGLENIRERLAGIYGGKARLTLEANDPKGVVSAIEVPREGARPISSGAFDPIMPPPPEPPKGAAAKTLAALGTAERVWRKGLSFAFIALVIVAAVVCGLALVGVLTGMLPVHLGDDTLGGPMGALIGTAGILLAFTLLVLAIAIVVAIFYGLGFLVVGLLVFIPLVIIVAMVPALAPFIIVGLIVWWFVRRHERKKAAAAAAVNAAPAPTAPAAEKPAS
jgi:hypothetical protein